MSADTSQASPRHRPKAATVFAAAFVAGAVAAVVVNRVLDVHLAQAKPQVESEPIFVTLRPLAQGAPVTVWDVALRDWPRAMLPSTALRATDSFSGSVLKYPLREGQPLLSVHLVATEPAAAVARPPIEEAYVPPPQAKPVADLPRPERSPDMWMPGATAAARPAEQAPPAQATPPVTTAVSESAGNPSPEFADVAVAPPAAEPAEDAAPERAPPADTVATSEPALAEPGAEAEEAEEAEEADRAPIVTEPTLAAADAPEDVDSPEVPLPAVASEPAPVAGVPPEAAETSAPLPAAPRQARLSADIEAALDVPSRPAIDLESMPSVMAHGHEAGPPAEEPRPGSVRYLVVPERIARQADTLFAVPEAPAVEEPAAAPAGPNPQPAATGKQPAPRSATEPRQQRTGSTAGGRQPQPSAQRPTPQQPTGRQPEPPPAQARSLGPRAWGGMFPNLSAGAEAIGNRWRGEEPVAGEPARTGPPRK